MFIYKLLFLYRIDFTSTKADFSCQFSVGLFVNGLISTYTLYFFCSFIHVFNTDCMLTFCKERDLIIPYVLLLIYDRASPVNIND